MNSAHTNQAASWSVNHYDPESSYYDPSISPSQQHASPSAYSAPAEQHSDEIYNNPEYHDMHVELHPQLDYVNCVEDGLGRVKINGGSWGFICLM